MGMRHPAAEDLAEIVFTSGTTADPKGVLITHRNLAASLRPLQDQIAPYRKYIRLFAPVRVLNLLPLSHLFGQALTILLPPQQPASVVFISSFSAHEIVRQIRDQARLHPGSRAQNTRSLAGCGDPPLSRGSRLFPRVRPMAAPLVAFPRVHRMFGWKFCCFIVGGAPLPADLEQFWNNLGFVIVQGYGLTETAPIISFSHPFHVRPGTAGKPMAGVELKIAADGEILVRGDNVTPRLLPSLPRKRPRPSTTAGFIPATSASWTRKVT